MNDQTDKQKLWKIYGILMGVMVGGSVLILGGQAAWNDLQQNWAKSNTPSNSTTQSLTSTPSITVSHSDLPLSTTPEQTIKNFYALTTKDNKAAGKLFTTEDFKRKYPSIKTDNQKKWVSKFNFIQVTQMNPIEKSPTRAKMTVWLLYSFKDGSPEACEYRDFTLVLNNNNFLIDDIGEATQTSCP